MGFEQSGDSLEEYRHCCSHARPHRDLPGVGLFGRDASQPAPARIMAFRHAFVLLNGPRLRRLEWALQGALEAFAAKDVAKQEEAIIFGHPPRGKALVLPREAFSIATLQLRWGGHEALSMPRHVDGGASLLHMTLSLAGRRTVSFEHLGEDGKAVGWGDHTGHPPPPLRTRLGLYYGWMLTYVMAYHAIRQ